MRWLTQMLAWVCTLFVARLLTPADYGLFGMATVFFALIALIGDLGLGAAIVANRGLTDNQIAQINSLSVFLGVIGFGLSCAAAVPVARFFRTPELIWVVLAMSVQCVLSGFRIVPASVLEKELRFKPLAIMESIHAITAALSMFVLAFLGLRYWALVFSVIGGGMLWTGMVVFMRPCHFAWPRLRSLKYAISLSRDIFFSRLSWYFQSQMDFLVAGRVLGQDALGAYTVGWVVASTPTNQIAALVARVTYPVFAAVQNNIHALSRYLLILTEGLAWLTFPAAIGLALVADDFVFLLLGEKWQAATGPLRILALLIIIRAIVPFLPQILFVTGESRFAMLTGVVAALVLPICFYIGSYWGIIGIAAVWVTVYPIATVPLYRRVFEKVGLSPSAYLRALWPAFSASLLMGGVVWILRQNLPPDWSVVVRFLLEVFVGGVVYVVAVMAFHRERLQALYNDFKNLSSQNLSCSL